MNPKLESAFDKYAPLLIKTMKEFTRELKSCRPDASPNEQPQPETEDRWTPLPNEPSFAIATEITADGRHYKIPESPEAEMQEDRPPLRHLRAFDSNLQKNNNKRKDRSTARLSTGGKKQRGENEPATRYNRLIQSDGRDMSNENDDITVVKVTKKTGNRNATQKTVKREQDVIVDPICLNAPTSLALEGFSSAAEVIQTADRIRRRQNPSYRDEEVVIEERRSGTRLACVTCRLHAYEAAEGKENYKQIYDDIVAMCTHVPSGASSRCKI